MGDVTSCLHNRWWCGDSVAGPARALLYVGLSASCERVQPRNSLVNLSCLSDSSNVDCREKRAKMDYGGGSSPAGRLCDGRANDRASAVAFRQRSEPLLGRFGDRHDAPVKAVHPPVMNGALVHASLDRVFDVIVHAFGDLDDAGEGCDVPSILRWAMEGAHLKLYVNTVRRSDGTFDSHVFVDDIWFLSATGAPSEQAAVTLAYREVWRKLKDAQRGRTENPRRQRSNPAGFGEVKREPPPPRDTVPDAPEPGCVPLSATIYQQEKATLRDSAARYTIPDFDARSDPTQVMKFHQLSAGVVRCSMGGEGREVSELLQYEVNAHQMSLALANTVSFDQREHYCHVFVDNIWLASAKASNTAEAREQACWVAWTKLQGRPLFVGPSLEFIGNDELYVVFRGPQQQPSLGGPSYSSPDDYQDAATGIRLPDRLLCTVLLCALSQMVRGMRIRNERMALKKLKRAACRLGLALSFSAGAGGRTVDVFIENMWLTEGTGATMEAAEVSAALSAIEMLRDGTAVPGPSVASQRLLLYVPDDERIDGSTLAKGVPCNNVIILVPHTLPRELVEQHLSAYPAQLAGRNTKLTRGALQNLCLFAKLFAFRDLVKQAEGKEDLAALVTRSAARARLDMSCSPEHLPQGRFAHAVLFNGVQFARGIGTHKVRAQLAAFSEIKSKITGDVFAVSRSPCGTKVVLDCLQNCSGATSRGHPRLPLHDGQQASGSCQLPSATRGEGAVASNAGTARHSSKIGDKLEKWAMEVMSDYRPDVTLGAKMHDAATKCGLNLLAQVQRVGQTEDWKVTLTLGGAHLAYAVGHSKQSARTLAYESALRIIEKPFILTQIKGKLVLVPSTESEEHVEHSCVSPAQAASSGAENSSLHAQLGEAGHNFAVPVTHSASQQPSCDVLHTGIPSSSTANCVAGRSIGENSATEEAMESDCGGDRVSVAGASSNLKKPKEALLLKFVDMANAIPDEGIPPGMSLQWLEGIVLRNRCTLSYSVEVCAARAKPKSCDIFVNDIWLSCGEGVSDMQAKNDAGDAALRRLKRGPLRIDVGIVVKGKLQLFCRGDDADMEALKRLQSEQIKAELGNFVLMEDRSGHSRGPLEILTTSAAANAVPYHFRPSDDGQYCTVELAGHVLGSSVGQTKMSKHEAAAEALEMLRSFVPTIVVKQPIDAWGAEVALPSEKRAAAAGDKQCGPEIPSDNIGHRLLTRMGWTGGAIGRLGEGIVEPLMPAEALGRQGLGYEGAQKSPDNKALRRTADRACLEYAKNVVLQDLVFSPAMSKRLGTYAFDVAKRYGLKCNRVKRPQGKSYVVSHKMLPQQLLCRILSEGPTDKYEVVMPAQPSSVQE